MPTRIRAVAAFSLLSIVALPTLAQAGCPYMTASMSSPAYIARNEPFTLTSELVGGTPTPAPTYTWTMSYRNASTGNWTGATWVSSSAHPTLNITLCGYDYVTLILRVRDACGVEATTARMFAVNNFQC
jgi:hypothetical protein